MNREILGDILKRMSDDGQPEENIAKVANHYNALISNPEAKEDSTPEQEVSETPNNKYKNSDGSWKTVEQLEQEFFGGVKDDTEEVTTTDEETIPTTDTETPTENAGYQPGETHAPGDGYEYKFDVDPTTGYPTYYTRRAGKDEWIQVDPETNEEGNITNPSFLSIGQEFGHFGEEVFDKKAYLEQQRAKRHYDNLKKEQQHKKENPQSYADMNLTPVNEGDNTSFIRGNHRITLMPNGKWYKQPLDASQMDFGLNYNPADIQNFPGQEMPQKFVDKINSVQSVADKIETNQPVSNSEIRDYIFPKQMQYDIMQGNLDFAKKNEQFKKENNWTAGLDDTEIAEIKYKSYDDPIDYRNPKTWIKKDEDEVKKMIEDNFENVEVEAFGVGNNVNIIAPDGKSFRIDLMAFTEEGRDGELQKLNDFIQHYDGLVASNKIDYSLNSLFGERRIAASDFMTDDGLEKANQILKESKLDYYIDDNVPGGLAGYNIVSPEGETVYVKNANEVTEWFFNNLTDNDKSLIDQYNINQRANVLEKRKNFLEQEKINLTNDEVENSYFVDGNVVENVLFDLDNMKEYEGISDETLALVKSHLEKPITETQTITTGSGGMYGGATSSRQIEVPVEGWQKTRYENLKEELKGKISEEEYSLLTQYLDSGQAVSNKRIQAKRVSIAENNSNLYIETYLQDNLKLKLGSKDIVNKTVNSTIREKQEIDSGKAILQDEFEKQTFLLNKRFDNVKLQIENAGAGVEVIGEGDDAIMVVSHPDPEIQKDLQAKLTEINNKSKTLRTGFETSWNEFTTKEEEWKLSHIDKFGEEYTLEDNTNLNNLVNKEYNRTQLIADDFFDGFRSFGYNISSAFGSDEMLRRAQSLNNGKAANMTKLTMDQAYRFNRVGLTSARTFAEQGANTVIAIGSSILLPGAGTVLGISASTLATAAAFGLSSGGGKRVELITRNQEAENATKSKKRLQQLWDEGLITDYDEYSTSMMSLSKVEALGGLSNAQIFGSSLTAGLIEGGVMLGFGTAVNALKFKGLIGGVSSGAGNEMTKTIGRRVLDFTIGTGKMVGGEVAEELTVLGLDTFGDKLILGDEIAWDELKKEGMETVWSSIISSGPMSGAGQGFNQIVNHLAHSDARNTWFNEVKPGLARIDKAMKALDKTDPKNRKQLQVLANSYAQLMSKMADVNVEAQLNAIMLGPVDAENIIVNTKNLQGLYAEAGVTAGMTDAEIDVQLENYMSKMDSEERSNFQTNLKETRKQIDAKNNVDYGDSKDAMKYEVDDNGNVTGGVIFNTFGAKGLAKAEALSKQDPTFKDKSAKDQMLEVYKALQKAENDKQIRKVKKNQNHRESVERQVYFDENGEGITKAEWLEQNNKKRVPSDLKAKEDAMYNIVSKYLSARNAEALVLHLEGKESKDALLKDKRLSNLTVEEANGLDDLKVKIQQQVELDNISQEKADQLINGINEGKVKAAIVGNQYITTEKNATDAAIENGDLLAGTAMAHEIAHFIDDTAMNDSERVSYAENLNEYINKEMPDIDDQVIEHNKNLSGDARYREFDEKGNALSFKDQTPQAKDEYTKRVQDLLMQDRNKKHKKKIQKQSQTGFLNRMRGVVGGQFNINNAKDAAAWMGSYLTGFENGEVGILQKRKLDNIKNQENVDSKGYRASSNLQQRLEQMGEAEPTSQDAAMLATDMLMQKPDGSPVDGSVLESELAQNIGGLVESITKKLYDPIAPDARRGVERNAFKEAVVTKAWEIMSRGYDPSKMSLDKYVSFLLNERSKDIARELGIESTAEFGGRGIDVNIDDTKGLMSDLDADEAFNQEAEKVTNPELPLTENLNVSEDDNNTINQAVNKAVGTKLPDIAKQVSKNKFTTPFISGLKKAFGIKNGPIHKAILNTLGKTKQEVEASFRDPAVRATIIRSAPTSWLAKNFPETVQKSVGGTRVKNADGTTKFTPNWTSDWKGQKIDRWNANDVGPYRGNTSGPQVIRRNPAATTMVTPAMMISKFAKGDTMTDMRRGGLDGLTLMMSQEYGLEVFKNDLNNEGPISQTFKGRQELFDRVLAENYVEEIGRQIERGTAKFSESGDSGQNLVGEAINFELENMFKDLASKYNRKTGGVTELDHLLEGYSEENVNSFKALGLYDMFGDSKGYMALVKEMDWGDRYADQMNDYKENAHSKIPQSHKEAYNNFVNKMIDVFPPKLLDVLGYEFFGLNNHRILDGAETKQDGSQGKYFPTRQKLQNKAKQKGGELNLPFDPDGLEVMNSKLGIMNDIQNILNEDISREDKLKKLDKLQPRIDAANANNKKALAWMLGEMSKEIAKDPSLALGLGIMQQAATNNVKGFRALTDLGMIKVMDRSQAPYVTPNGKFTNSKTSKIKGELVANELNTKHPDYQRANELAKGDEKKIGKLLSNKGEHIDPSAPVQSRLLKMTLDVATRLAEARPEDQQQIINEFYNEVQLELINFDQSLGPKIDSDIQDSRLGSTSKIGYNRNLAISDELKNYVDVKQGGDAVNLINTKASQLIQKLGQKDRLDLQSMDKAKENVKLSEGDNVGASVFDFDETLIDKGENTIIATKGDQTVTISSGDWPLLGPQYAAQGFDFNFDDFINVRGGVEGPLMQKFRNQIAKYGTDNVFILTARPAEAAPAIQAWLKTQGIDLPIENITGLGDSRGDAKAQWFINKYAEGYNDMYFVDDAVPNVEAVQHVFDQFDNKGKAVLVRNSEASVDPSLEFNNIIEEVSGVESFKEFSEAKARQRGKDKGRFRFFIPPSAEDFKGLIYNFLGKGERGDAHLSFFKRELIDPYAKAQRQIDAAQQSITNDYRTVKKGHKPVIKKLNKKIPGTEFTYDQGVRVLLWDRAGFDIPGLSPTDKNKILSAIGKEGDVISYANDLSLITKIPEGYLEPGEFWITETIGSDLSRLTQDIGRTKYLEPFKQQRSKIFGEWEGQKLVGPNMNKIEAIYGTRFREALTDILWRMENGTNRTFGNNRLVNAFANWINNSVGAIMFFNARSAVLQTLSTVNFINFGNNNIFAASKAFANQPQFWADFSMLFNSDMLKQRRAGFKTDINQNELAAAAKAGKGDPKAALQYLLKIGFLPTQIADSFAISLGGASFYRNQVNAYIKDGVSRVDAEKRAMIDFQEKAEETQQSSRPDLISQQQASALGRFILAFQNTPMQYARLTKKAALDLINRRGSDRQNISKIIYYGAAQNIIFSSLQSAMFKFIYDDDEEEETESKARLANSVVDSFLRGTGVYGAIAATFKNMVMRFMKESERGGQMDQGRVLVEMLNLSPPVGSKARKLYSGLTTYKFNSDEMYEMDKLDIDNPMWQTIGNTVSAITNVPMDRAVNKIRNIKEALNQNNEIWQRIAMLMGWNTWDVGVQNQDLLDSGKRIRDAKKAEKKRIKEEEKKKREEERKKKEAAMTRCTARTRKGKGPQCKNLTENKNGKCYAHQ